MTTLKSKTTKYGADSDESQLKTLVAGNNSLAFDLYRTMRGRGTNLFFSPYSIITALVMAYAGARGDTEQAMANSLKFSLPQDRLHSAFNYLDISLSGRGQGARGKDGEGFKLHVVNTLWGQKDYKFLSRFLDVLAQNYGAELRILDFINKPDESRVAINLWISDQTGGNIKDLVPEGVISQLTRLILTNAIYFNAAWKYPFNENSTVDDAFHLIDGLEITVPMMQQTKSFRYSEGEDYQAVDLLYDGQELSMVILLPKTGNFRAFEDKLDQGLVKAIIQDLKMQEVALTMPKFEYSFSFSLKEALSILGMRIAFTGEANFSGMNGQYDLSIQDVLHKAFVAVDETGTKAAAATAVIMAVKFMPMVTTEMKVDRPFIFFIRDIPTESLIFTGRVLNPGK
jgi:serpin B